MAVTKIKLEGLEQLAKTNKKFFAQMKKSNRSIIGKEARRLSKQMQQVAPHDENNLRKAIEHRIYVDLPKGVVGAVVGITREMSRRHPEFRVGKDGKGWYPAYQEYGFFDKSGRYIINSYVRPIMLANRAKIKKALKDAYNKVIQNRSMWAGR